MEAGLIYELLSTCPLMKMMRMQMNWKQD